MQDFVVLWSDGKTFWMRENMCANSTQWLGAPYAFQNQSGVAQTKRVRRRRAQRKHYAHADGEGSCPQNNAQTEKLPYSS